MSEYLTAMLKIVNGEAFGPLIGPGITTYEDEQDDPRKHLACLELEQLRLIERAHEFPGGVAWRPMQKVYTDTWPATQAAWEAKDRELTELRRDKAVATTALGVLREALGEPEILLVEAAVKAAGRIKQFEDHHARQRAIARHHVENGLSPTVKTPRTQVDNSGRH